MRGACRPWFLGFSDRSQNQPLSHVHAERPRKQASGIHGVLRRPAGSPDIPGNQDLNRKGSDGGNGFGKACRILKHQSPVAAC
jgi:hypothetical protein